MPSGSKLFASKKDLKISQNLQSASSFRDWKAATKEIREAVFGKRKEEKAKRSSNGKQSKVVRKSRCLIASVRLNAMSVVTFGRVVRHGLTLKFHLFDRHLAGALISPFKSMNGSEENKFFITHSRQKREKRKIASCGPLSGSGPRRDVRTLWIPQFSFCRVYDVKWKIQIFRSLPFAFMIY